MAISGPRKLCQTKKKTLLAEQGSVAWYRPSAVSKKQPERIGCFFETP
jgi:hypothetical protein